MSLPRIGLKVTQELPKDLLMGNGGSVGHLHWQQCPLDSQCRIVLCPQSYYCEAEYGRNGPAQLLCGFAPSAMFDLLEQEQDFGSTDFVDGSMVQGLDQSMGIPDFLAHGGVSQLPVI